jgi:FtsH-binding integral membrane protein
LGEKVRYHANDEYCVSLRHPSNNIDILLLHYAVPLIGLLISTIAWWITLSSEEIRQTSIMRMPLLIAFTIGQSIAVGFISSAYAYSSVIKAMVTTAAATLSVTIYTLVQKNPKYDLSQWGRALSGLGMAFLLYGMIHVLELFGILPHGFLPYSEAMYSILGAGMFSLYLAHHTRLIVSGKSAKFQLNEKDYILGAMSVYSDIINIFLYILRILGEVDDRDKR